VTEKNRFYWRPSTSSLHTDNLFLFW